MGTKPYIKILLLKFYFKKYHKKPHAILIIHYSNVLPYDGVCQKAKPWEIFYIFDWNMLVINPRPQIVEKS